MLDSSYARGLLVVALEAEADWRYSVAEQYPEDDRNLRSARSLEAAASYVRQLPISDERLAAIAAIIEPWHLDVLNLPDEAQVGRFGFHHNPVTVTDYDSLIESIVEHLASSQIDLEHEDNGVES